MDLQGSMRSSAGSCLGGATCAFTYGALQGIVLLLNAQTDQICMNSVLQAWSSCGWLDSMQNLPCALRSLLSQKYSSCLRIAPSCRGKLLYCIQ